MTENTESDAVEERRRLLEELFPAESGEVSDAARGRLLRTKDVALLFQVSDRTVAEWARTGKIPSVRTPGGYRRYSAVVVAELLREIGVAPGSETR